MNALNRVSLFIFGFTESKEFVTRYFSLHHYGSQASPYLGCSFFTYT